MRTASAQRSTTATPGGRRFTALARRLWLCRVLRYLLAGGTSALADLAVLVLLRELAGVPLPLAVLGGYLVGAAANYVFVSRLGFGMSAHGPALLRYAALLLANVVATVCLVELGTSLGIPYVVTKGAVLVLLAAINFRAYSAFVFRGGAALV